MIDELFCLTEKLCAVHAAPGREEKLAEMLVEMSKPYCDEVYTDRLGNVICHVSGVGEKAKKVVFGAHMDETAYMVIGIDAMGFVHFFENGGLSTLSSEYREVIFESGIHGVLVPPASGSFKSVDMMIDIGAKSREEAQKYVKVGDDIYAPSGVFRSCGNVISGRPLDDRVGIAVTFLTMKKLFEGGKKPYNDMYFVYTVQEEIALPSVGAAYVAKQLDPDIFVAVDMGDSCDMPGRYLSECELGSGAAILLRDITMVTDRKLADSMIRVANECGAKAYGYVSRQGGCDALPAQRFMGCRAGFISIPFRYMHTNGETCDLSDAEDCVKLMRAMCDDENL